MKHSWERGGGPTLPGPPGQTQPMADNNTQALAYMMATVLRPLQHGTLAF